MLISCYIFLCYEHIVLKTILKYVVVVNVYSFVQFCLDITECFFGTLSDSFSGIFLVFLLWDLSIIRHYFRCTFFQSVEISCFLYIQQ